MYTVLNRNTIYDMLFCKGGLRNRSDIFCRILEGMKRKDLRKLPSNATDELKTCDDTKKGWCELIIDIF